MGTYRTPRLEKLARFWHRVWNVWVVSRIDLHKWKCELNPAVSAVVMSRDMFDEPASQLAFLLGAGFFHGGVSLANR